MDKLAVWYLQHKGYFVRHPHHHAHRGDTIEWWNEDTRHEGVVRGWDKGNYLVDNGRYDGIIVCPYRVSKIIKETEIHESL